MVITASMVKELREMTGAGMMECKKALADADGDMNIAIDNMRKSGQAKAAKRAGRVAAEGMAVIAANDAGNAVALLEVNCETDFVARDENFKTFAAVAAQAALDSQSTTVEGLMKQVLADGSTLERAREALVLKIGENVQVRRVAYVTATGCVGVYLHGGRIGVLVAIDQNNPELSKDIAMHVAATNPLAIDESGVPAEVLVKEREIIAAQAGNSGKSTDIIEKMVEGRIQKYLKEVCLISQPFVKNPDQTIADLLKIAHAKVTRFVRFEVGEGIEKEVVDLAKEVNATLKGSA